MNELNRVQKHYTRDELSRRIENALDGAGMTNTPLLWSELAAFDQFHVRGLEATQELADGLKLSGGETLLDVGCGLGGPARFLAAVRGCHVTGIDLSHSFIEAANLLGQRTGLLDYLTFVQGDALALPFPDASFDHAWTQHVAMNLPNKGHLYGEIHRVLKEGGRLAIYDVVQGENTPLIYPVPWARNEDISFLATPDAMTQSLRDAGFGIVSLTDTTHLAQNALPPQGANPNGLNLGLVMGPDFGQMAANLFQNLREGRAGLLQIIAQKETK